MGQVKTTIRSLTTLAQIHDLTFRPINPPLQPRLKWLTNTRSQQSVYSKIRHCKGETIFHGRRGRVSLQRSINKSAAVWQNEERIPVK